MLVKYSVKNPILVNLLMFVIIIVGVLSYRMMPRELIPEFSSNAITIITFYPGASAEEMDKLVTANIESVVEGLQGVDEVFCTSQEGISRVVVKGDTNAPESEMLNLLDDVRNQVNLKKSDLPDDAKDPVVSLVKPNIPIINIAVFGNVPELMLKETADDLKEYIEDINGVNSVQIAGIRDREVWIEINPLALEKYGMKIDAVKAALARSQLDLAAGTIKSDKGEFLVRVVGETEELDVLRDILLFADYKGAEIRLRDVAKVTDTFADSFTIGRYNGERCAILLLSKESDADAIDISRSVYRILGEYQEKLPKAVQVAGFSDTSIFIENRLSTLFRQGLQALLLVLATLCLFLSLRMAFFTALGIPISFLGGVILISFFGYSMNMITMFAFIMVLGLVVDDAIVVSENCFRLMEKGIRPKIAAVVGARQMLWPVVAAVATTIAAFLPLMMLSGNMGKFIGAIPVTVSLVLVVSLIECLLILPSHIADWTPVDYAKKLASRTKENGGRFFAKFLDGYQRVLKKAIKWRYVFVAGFIVLFFLAVGYAVYMIPLKFAKEFEGDQFIVNIECPSTYRIEDTERAAKGVEKVLLSLPKNELMGFSTTIGVFADDPYAYRFASNIAQFFIDLHSLEQRRTTTQVMDIVRRGIAKIPGLVTYKVAAIHGNPGGKAIEIHINGDDITILRKLSKIAKDFLHQQAGTRDVQDNFVLGKREIIIRLREKARSYGFDNYSLATQLRTAYSGYEAARIRPGDEDFPIYVRYDSSARDFRESVEDIRLITPSGERVKLTEVAEITEAPGLQSIKRHYGHRSITVTAEINDEEGNAEIISSALMSMLDNVIKEKYAGYSVSPGGQKKELSESLDSMMRAAVIALLLILIILTALFRSLAKSLIIMLPIPLSLIGVVIGHIVHGADIVILSIMGSVALAGVVVNDSILLLDFITRARREGLTPYESAVRSGKMRMRPVLLTSITTVCGLSSIAFFATGQTKFLAPMAISIVWGIAFATFITLLVVPCAYLIYIDVRRLLGRSEESELADVDIDSEIESLEKNEEIMKEEIM